MDKFKDIFEGWIAELKETPNDKLFLGTAKIKWGRSDVFNKNKRYYAHTIATPAIENFNKEAQKNVGVIGQLDHPLGTSGTLLSNASHLITKVWVDKDKVWWAEAKIMGTTTGKNLLTVLKTKTKIGASLRGFGEVGNDGKVKAGLEIRAIDFVASPSFGASATVDQSNVFESYIADEKYEFSEDDLTAVTGAMDELSDATVELLQERLKKEAGGDWSKGQVKALPIYIRMLKDDPSLPKFFEWYKGWQEKFAEGDPQHQQALNEELYSQSLLREEKNIAGLSYGISRKRIEARQKEIDEALSGKSMSEKTISRLFAEYCLAGGKLSRADWIKEFGF